MRIVVDTNIVFSAILNTNSKIAKIILQPKSILNLYATNQLALELEKHRSKLKTISKYSEKELQRAIQLITGRIKFINVELVPLSIYQKAILLLKDIDIDDTEFIALTDHIRGKLWIGDKALINGMKKQNWNKCISTDDLYKTTVKRM